MNEWRTCFILIFRSVQVGNGEVKIWFVYNADGFPAFFSKITVCFPMYSYEVFIFPVDFCTVANGLKLMEHCPTESISGRTSGSCFFEVF